MIENIQRPRPLSESDLNQVIRHAPLVAIDLIIRDHRNRVLLGLRTNEPAKNYYFVPGGSIWKDELIRNAFSRILKTETNFTASLDQARFHGVYEHFYQTNRFDDPSFGTHYVVLCYEITSSKLLLDTQHSDCLWWNESVILASHQVHDNTKAYFRKDARRRHFL